MAQPPPSEQTVNEECGERQRRDEPDESDHAQPLLNLRLRRETCSRLPASLVAHARFRSLTGAPAPEPSPTRSSLHLVDLVHVHHRPVAICRQDDPKPNGDLGRRDDEDEDDEDAPALVDRAVLPREGDESEVRGVEHELDAHEDHDRVAADQQPRAPDEEERRRHDDVCAERNGHGRRRRAASSGSSRLVSTIAPTIAARRSTDAISNGKAKSVNTLVASAMRSPPPGDRKSTRLNSSHSQISYAVFCLKKKTINTHRVPRVRRPRIGLTLVYTA